jgi:HSP20 family protein
VRDPGRADLVREPAAAHPVHDHFAEREREGVLRRSARRTGRFEYQTLLPVKAEEVSATLHEGVLTVTVPKAQATKPRHIEITES